MGLGLDAIQIAGLVCGMLVFGFICWAICAGGYEADRDKEVWNEMKDKEAAK